MFIPIIYLILGVIAGTITGLLPGIHINLVSAILLSTPFISTNSPENAVVFIIAMAITHTFTDFIPSTFFGAPDEDTALGVLPGHKLLMEGKAHDAIKLSLIGSSLAIILFLILIPCLFLIIPKIYPFINRMMAFILIWLSIFIISKTDQKIISLIIFILAGFIGIATLNLPIKEPLLPLLTGLFGSSTLIYSFTKKTQPPKQKIKKLKFKKKEIIKPSLITFFISPLCSILPGTGSSQAALIGSEVLPKNKKLNEKQFIVLLGSINTLVMAISFISILTIHKARTGAANAIQNLTQTPHLTYIIPPIIISAIIALIITLLISKKLTKHIHKINYSSFSIIILIFLTLITLYFSGILGILVFSTSTTLGTICIKTKTRRTILMGALVIPTILFYLPF